MSKLLIVKFAGAVLLFGAATPAMSANPADCAALDQIYSKARTDFPALTGKSFDAAQCVHRRDEYRCQWTFPSDTFAMAETQVAKLKSCTAAQPRAQAIEGKRGESLFQLNPETTVAIVGPQLDSGSWAIGFRIKTTADWK